VHDMSAFADDPDVLMPLLTGVRAA
jgi:hypothetical protein